MAQGAMTKTAEGIQSIYGAPYTPNIAVPKVTSKRPQIETLKKLETAKTLKMEVQSARPSKSNTTQCISLMIRTLVL